MVYVVERRYTFKRNRLHISFNVPNHPMSLIRKDTLSSRKEYKSDEKALNYEKYKMNTKSEK